jgi:hypothetical protein
MPAQPLDPSHRRLQYPVGLNDLRSVGGALSQSIRKGLSMVILLFIQVFEGVYDL